MTQREKRHLPEQAVRKIQQADRILAAGAGVVAVLQELNIIEATYYRWRNHYPRVESRGRQEAEAAREAEPAVEETAH